MPKTYIPKPVSPNDKSKYIVHGKPSDPIPILK